MTRCLSSGLPLAHSEANELQETGQRLLTKHASFLSQTNTRHTPPKSDKPDARNNQFFMCTNWSVIACRTIYYNEQYYSDWGTKMKDTRVSDKGFSVAPDT